MSSSYDCRNCGHTCVTAHGLKQYQVSAHPIYVPPPEAMNFTTIFHDKLTGMS
jgi:hypothetical protein